MPLKWCEVTMAVVPYKLPFRLTTQRIGGNFTVIRLCSTYAPSTGIRAEHQDGQLFDCKCGRHGYARQRLAFVGLLVPLTSKTLIITSNSGITLSVDAVDSALMLQVAPAESVFSKDRKQPSLLRKLQRSAPPRAQ